MVCVPSRGRVPLPQRHDDQGGCDDGGEEDAHPRLRTEQVGRDVLRGGEDDAGGEGLEELVVLDRHQVLEADRVGAAPLRDRELLGWCTRLVTAVLGPAPAPAG